MKIGFDYIQFSKPLNYISVDDVVKNKNLDENYKHNLLHSGIKQVPISRMRLDKFINTKIRECWLDVIKSEHNIKYVILAHSNPFLAPEDSLFLEQSLLDLGIDSAVRFSVSGQPCAIMHQAIQLAVSLLSLEKDRTDILLIGADQAYSLDDRLFFNSIMGDAVFWGIVSNRAEHNIILSSVTESEIIACCGEMSPIDDIKSFREKNPSNIRHCIESAISKAGITKNDVSYIIPHTPYVELGNIISAIMRFPREKILDDYITDTGHLNSNDSFCHYARGCKNKKIAADDIVVLINPGFGGTRGCTVIKR